MIEKHSKDAFLSAAAKIQRSISELAKGYAELMGAYDGTRKAAFERGKSDGVPAYASPANALAGAIGPEFLNQSIRATFNAHGLTALFDATAKLGSDDRNQIPDLVEHLKQRLQAL
jgi:hypothetical protein